MTLGFSWSWGRPHALVQAFFSFFFFHWTSAVIKLQSSSLVLGFGNGQKWEWNTCTSVRVSFVWPTLVIATVPFSWFLFCHVEYHLFTVSSMAAKACQTWRWMNTWPPHYAAAHDWLKSKLWLTGVERSIPMPMMFTGSNSVLTGCTFLTPCSPTTSCDCSALDDSTAPCLCWYPCQSRHQPERFRRDPRINRMPLNSCVSAGVLGNVRDTEFSVYVRSEDFPAKRSVWVSGSQLIIYSWGKTSNCGFSLAVKWKYLLLFVLLFVCLFFLFFHSVLLIPSGQLDDSRIEKSTLSKPSS